MGDLGINFSLRAALSANSLDLPDALYVIRNYSKFSVCQLGEELFMSFLYLKRSYLIVARDFVQFGSSFGRGDALGYVLSDGHGRVSLQKFSFRGRTLFR